jgi:hypothetical protein
MWQSTAETRCECTARLSNSRDAHDGQLLVVLPVSVSMMEDDVLKSSGRNRLIETPGHALPRSLTFDVKITLIWGAKCM